MDNLNHKSSTWNVTVIIIAETTTITVAYGRCWPAVVACFLFGYA
jgi:hypothetical protein